MSTVRVQYDGAVAEVVLDDPEARNALTLASKVALRDALEQVGHDPEVRAVVLTGAGRTFCVGQHLGEHAAALEDGGAEAAFATVAEHYAPVVRALTEMPKPVVAAVNGACVGAGLGFALACDLRVFAGGAILATAFSGIGLTCDSGLSATLVRAVGEARARRLVLLGETFTAEEGVAWGIEGQVVAPEEVLPTAHALAARLAAGPTLAYAESKRLLAAAAAGTPLPEVLEAEGAAQTRLGATADHRGAVTAFLEKRRAEFQGR
jgi:2-(1,2-epoxy-1,2-dihydrophenyl)acetyl-CoA isomerase